jgi:alkylation response protein AidB-like acyl-CoA dehydrogenase
MVNTTWPEVHRAPGAGACDQRAEGVKGISLFVVLKVHGGQGRSARRNDIALRQHRTQDGHQRPAHRRSSVTTVAPSGSSSARKTRGLRYMFIMMNSARYAVSMQGIAIAERAYQNRDLCEEIVAKPAGRWLHQCERAHH